MARYSILIDGFNVYHSLQPDLQTYKWLDIGRLCKSFMRANDTVVDIFYYTAFYPSHPPNPEKRKRHKTYLSALKHTGIVPVLSTFKRKERKCKECWSHYTGYEEKETDVNIAMEMFIQAFHDKADVLCVVSGDSDLAPALTAVKKTFPEKRLMVIFPPRRASRKLRKAACPHPCISLKREHIIANQFPDTIKGTDAKGREITICKPIEWKAETLKPKRRPPFLRRLRVAIRVLFTR
ncbi:MAG: NYN domain-containing protein [Acidobacteriota bacterium]|nr:MAG: NYN domain-containing protein [Acidobacteriota bacterium]